MFKAFSKNERRIVEVNEILNTNDTFYCPNPACNARFTIKSFTGTRKAHFSRLPSTLHIEGCEYASISRKYREPMVEHRYSIEDIYFRLASAYSDENIHTKANFQKSNQKNRIDYIRTPISLYEFCRRKAPDTEYIPGVTVGDIFLDERNLRKDEPFLNINRLRMVVGTVTRCIPCYASFDSVLIEMNISTSNDGGEVTYLVARIRVPPNIFKQISTRIDPPLKTKPCKIAVLERWNIEQKRFISCKIRNISSIVFCDLFPTA